MAAETEFWDKYVLLRRRRMPVDSDIHEFLARHYARSRKQFDRKWSPYFDKKLPKSTVAWYNSLFEEGHAVVRDLFDGVRIEAHARRRADEYYGVRLKKECTLRDLLNLDLFGAITENQDIRPEIVLKGIPDPRKVGRFTKSDSHHFFFHRPQRTEFIFLHEIIVGYLLNRVENAGRFPKRAQMSLAIEDYPTASAYTLNLLARYLKIPDTRVVALHFQSSHEVRNALPEFVQDLMLISSHIYWYMDLFSKLGAAHSPSDLLRFTYLAFVVPSLERALLEGDLRLSTGSSRFVEAEFFTRLLSSERGGVASRNDSDIVRSLFYFAESIWRPRAARA